MTELPLSAAKVNAGDLGLRLASAADAAAIARLHADSWRRHYRGAYADAFLDGGAGQYCSVMWARRLRNPGPPACTIVAERDGELAGFAHTFLNHDPAWGSLIDNLHVRYGLKRQGIGTRLLALTGRAVLARSSPAGLYLWVLEQNTAARAFYAARGGTPAQRAEVPAPGGEPARLNGAPACLRYAWPDPARLLTD